MKIIFPKPTKKRQEEARGRVRALYLLLTNEPSNHKEWARGEMRKRMRTVGERRGESLGKRKRKDQKKVNVKRKEKRQGKNRIIEQGMGKKWMKRREKRNKI